MKSEIMLSVIVPVYNREKFIRRGAESVICQMDGRVELILVDDGSTDSSGTICDEYAAQYPDVYVVHKINGGLSSARNAGIEVATGRYVAFLDADDYLDQDTCSGLIDVILTYDPDMIDYGWKYIGSSGEITSNLHGVPKGELLDKCVIRDMILPPLLNLRKDEEHFIYDFACTKVFRTRILHEYNIRFDETRRIWEDRPFCIKYLLSCKTFFSIKKCFYNYVSVPDSLSHSYHLNFFNIILDNYNLYCALYGEMFDFDTQYVNDYWAHSIENMIFRSLEQKENKAIIRSNILDTLQNEQVVHWFAKRVPQDTFEKKMSALVLDGKTEEALRGYKKRAAQKQRKQTVDNTKNFVRGCLRKIIGR